VPDGGFHRGSPRGVYLPTAAIVVEVVSPDDETYLKIDFYASHGVEELIVADPELRAVRIWQLIEGALIETGQSELLGISVADLMRDIVWP
jgi:Uma2 family endonuclease